MFLEFALGFLYHMESVLLKNPEVSLFISLVNIAAAHGFSNSKMIKFPCMGFHGNYEIT